LDGWTAGGRQWSKLKFLVMWHHGILRDKDSETPNLAFIDLSKQTVLLAWILMSTGRLRNKVNYTFYHLLIGSLNRRVQVALVTGAGSWAGGPFISLAQGLISFLSGIGLQSSILFAQEGASVLLVDVNIEAAQRATEIIKRKHPDAKVLAIRADVGQEADVKAAVDTAVKQFGRLDIMVLSIL
jgi:hypothetical protein